MTSPAITMKVKALVFDSRKVRRAVDRGKQSALQRAGAFIWRRAKSSIRKRKGISKPGKPPHSHQGTLRRFMRFGYDALSESVVVGPMKTNQVFFNMKNKPVRGTIPQILEEGGAIQVFEVFKFGQWQRADLRSRRRLAGRKTRMRRVNIKPRPFMVPALEKERQNIPQAFRNSIRNG